GTKGPAKETQMHADTEPVIVRGLLGPIVEGAPNRPRGLLIGLPGGMSFEYRIDDVRLLGVRQGEFVDRTDWDDRGGTTLKTLGKLVPLLGGGNPGAVFSVLQDARRTPLEAQMAGSWVHGGDAGLSMRLRAGGAGPVLAKVEESPRAE